MSNSSFSVTLEPSGRTFLVDAGESVLDGALRAGLALPYGCRNAACRSCEGRIVDGDVHYPDGPPSVVDTADAGRGVTLLCAARARSDLRIAVEEIAAGHRIVVRTVMARVRSLEVLAHDVMSVALALRETEPMHFLAGQYVDIVLRDGRRRAFSLATAPARAVGASPGIELHVRRVPGGEFSAYAFEHLKTRALLRVHGPLGNFYLRKDAGRPAILVAGGTGFAPIKSIVEDALEGGYEGPLQLYWGVRACRDLYHHDLALGWARDHANVTYTPVLSEPDPADGWTGRTGWVHEAVLADHPDLGGHAAYLSGPPPMVDAGRGAFLRHGMAPDAVFYDAFDYAYETGHDRG